VVTWSDLTSGWGALQIRTPRAGRPCRAGGWRHRAGCRSTAGPVCTWVWGGGGSGHPAGGPAKRAPGRGRAGRIVYGWLAGTPGPPGGAPWPPPRWPAR